MKETNRLTTVHLMGAGKGWDLAPVQGEVWGVNDDIILLRDMSILFDMHDKTGRLNKHWPRVMEAIGRVNQLKIPFISVKKYPEIPTSQRYPLEEIVKFFGTDYFTNSLDFMIAYAVYKGVSEINMYGMNMSVETEYSYEKPGVEFWVGMARGRGVKVNIFGSQSEILRSVVGRIYGFEVEQESVRKLREDLEAREKEGLLEESELKLYERFVIKPKTWKEWVGAERRRKITAFEHSAKK